VPGLSSAPMRSWGGYLPGAMLPLDLGRSTALAQALFQFLQLAHQVRMWAIRATLFAADAGSGIVLPLCDRSAKKGGGDSRADDTWPQFAHDRPKSREIWSDRETRILTVSAGLQGSAFLW
jgi:hypothetical protein